MRKWLAAGLLLSALPAFALNPELRNTAWHAKWIGPSEGSTRDFGVYHFRRHLPISSVPMRYLVHVSADNRYQLFVNGKRIAEGPARGDLNHWRFESIDLAPYLRAGDNVLAAVVWNLGTDAPVAQETFQTGFLLQGDSAGERAIDTDAQWKYVRDEAYEPIPVTWRDIYGYWAAGRSERFDAARYPWGWEKQGFDDASWKSAAVIAGAAMRDASDSPSRWMLVERSIPMMEEHVERLATLRKAQADFNFLSPFDFPAKSGSFQVPAGKKLTLLLDHAHLTTAFPELLFSGGKGATIKIQYAESLYEAGKREKGNRNEIDGKEFVGYYDEVTADGGADRIYRPLWWRTWRYMRLTIQAADSPLQIDGLQGIATSYPFERKAQLQIADPEIQKILDTGWRTARLCAHETYMDCPYYEQLQYAGDTRIQVMVSLYMTGDARLARNAVEQIDASRTAEGATFSRAPSRLQQYIPPFSLWWIGMVHDLWQYQDDTAFVKRMLPGVRAVLGFFARYQKENGSLDLLPWWNYVDWTKQWKRGVPPSEADGSSAPIDLQLLLAYQWAAELEQSAGSPVWAHDDLQQAEKLAHTIQSIYYDPVRKLYADTPAKNDFSQQANVLAVLSGVARGPQATDLLRRTLADQTLVQCSIYFQSYALAALKQAGLGDQYLDSLGEWRSMLSRGLTTWAESYEPSRSDCHAWGASPNFELFRTVAGIDSAAAGFRKVRIEPHLGKLNSLKGSIPHPRGTISVVYQRHGGKLEATISLPEGTTGEFIWNGQSRPLPAGETQLVF